jgi:enoyl-CoA hydratase
LDEQADHCCGQRLCTWRWVELCLACDLVAMEEHAEIGLPEVLRGVAARGRGLERLPRRISPSIALEAILTGRPLSASRAYELDLANAVVPTGGAVERALQLADAICLGAPLAVRYSLQLARASFAEGEQEAVDVAAARRAW